MGRLEEDPRRVKLAELFASDGAPIAGNVEAMPTGLPVDDMPHTTKLVRVDIRGRELQSARVIARRLPSGDILLIGHDAGDLRQIGQVVARSLGPRPASRGLSGAVDGNLAQQARTAPDR